MISTSDPDIDKIHDAVKKALDGSSGKSTKKKSTEETTTVKKQNATGEDTATTGGSIGNLRDGYAANQTDDLSDAC